MQNKIIPMKVSDELPPLALVDRPGSDGVELNKVARVAELTARPEVGTFNPELSSIMVEQNIQAQSQPTTSDDFKTATNDDNNNTSDPSTVSSQAAGLAPLAAKDEDLIEKEWVDRAKHIVEETKQDPYKQEEEVSVLQADYLKKRYGRVVETRPKK